MSLPRVTQLTQQSLNSCAVVHSCTGKSGGAGEGEGGGDAAAAHGRRVDAAGGLDDAVTLLSAANLNSLCEPQAGTLATLSRRRQQPHIWHPAGRVACIVKDPHGT